MHERGVFSFPASAVWLALPSRCPKDSTVHGALGPSRKQHCFKVDEGFSSDRIISVFFYQVPVSLHRGTLLQMLSSNVSTPLSVWSPRMMATWAWWKASSTLVLMATHRRKGDTRSWSLSQGFGDLLLPAYCQIKLC